MGTWEKKISLKDSLVAFLVTGADGKVDEAASRAKFEDHLGQYIVRNSADNELITSCMTELYDTHRGVRISLEAVASMCVSIMQGRDATLKNPAMFSTLRTRVLDLLHENTGEGKTYNMTKGLGGGFARTVDRPLPTPKEKGEKITPIKG
jgi:hypothetical protein